MCIITTTFYEKFLYMSLQKCAIVSNSLQTTKTNYCIIGCLNLNKISIHNVFQTFICKYNIPWRRVLLVKLTASQLVKKFPTFYGTQKYINAITTARHVSLF
jgi:hypothetical protein